eukprot:TRINITY_DN19197_c0_g1_i1.p1 TRINITY_DN19197_c0_g1~~TRINITY_DN19197_c0_g1_i1.p1  ORF type:complete len:310 (+),score=39.22 TRINITY_DN19197_c0_g1_i1:43-930(+)
MTLAGANLDDIWNSFKAGFMAATISKAVVAPLDRVKIIFQVQNCDYRITNGEVAKFNGIVPTVRRLVAEQGAPSLWRGFLPDVLRFAPAFAFNFLFLEHFRGFVPDKKEHGLPVHVAGNILAGSAAGLSSLVLVHPFDVMRTRIAADHGTGYGRTYRGLIDCACKSLRHTGVTSGFYAGFWITCPSIILGKGVYLGLFETVRSVRPSMTLMESWISAQLIVLISSFITFPLDTAKRRLMLQSGSRDVMYNNARGCIRKVVNTEGVRGLFNGALTNSFRSVGSALTLVLYDRLTRA